MMLSRAAPMIAFAATYALTVIGAVGAEPAVCSSSSECAASGASQVQMHAEIITGQSKIGLSQQGGARSFARSRQEPSDEKNESGTAAPNASNATSVPANESASANGTSSPNGTNDSGGLVDVPSSPGAGLNGTATGNASAPNASGGLDAAVETPIAPLNGTANEANGNSSPNGTNDSGGLADVPSSPGAGLNGNATGNASAANASGGLDGAVETPSAPLNGTANETQPNSSELPSDQAPIEKNGATLLCRQWAFKIMVPAAIVKAIMV